MYEKDYNFDYRKDLPHPRPLPPPHPEIFVYIRDGGLNIPHKYKLLYELYKQILKNLCNIPPPFWIFY